MQTFLTRGPTVLRRPDPRSGQDYNILFVAWAFWARPDPRSAHGSRPQDIFLAEGGSRPAEAILGTLPPCGETRGGVPAKRSRSSSSEFVPRPSRKTPHTS